jgi:hypothetical protein
LASPFGCRVERELSSRRADSQALAASTTIFARTCLSRPVALSTYETPVARPSASVVTSRAIAPVRIVSRPVASAGGSSTPGTEKFELVAQPRPHCPQ